VGEDGEGCMCEGEDHQSPNINLRKQGEVRADSYFEVYLHTF